MARRSEKRLSTGAGGVPVARQAWRGFAAWRLDVRPEDAEHGGVRKGSLRHYISAGGLRQLRRTPEGEAQEVRQRLFLFVLAGLALLWLVFYFLPSN